jgi:hypothetical protein
MRGTLPWWRRLRPILVVSIHQARARIGVVSGEFDINVSAAVDLLMRTKFPSERLDDKTIAMNGLAVPVRFVHSVCPAKTSTHIASTTSVSLVMAIRFWG